MTAVPGEPQNRMVVLPKPLKCCNCCKPFLVEDEIRDANPERPDGEEFVHVVECETWKPAGPISDGTLQCPESHDGVQCTRRIPKGWHENEGHGGGHWFQSSEQQRLLDAGHVDLQAMFSGLPYEAHLPADCPDITECRRKGWTR